MSFIEPTSIELFSTIQRAVDEIKPLERVKIFVPRNYSHGGNNFDWVAFEQLQMEFCGSALKPNVFVTLRSCQEYGAVDVIVDIYHAPN